MNLHRLVDKVEHILAPKYKLEKEHKQIGFTYWDRPHKRYDAFAADTTIAWTIYPILVRYRRAEKNGVPILRDRNLQTTTFDDKDHKEMEEEWNAIVDSMIYAFENVLHDDFILDEDYGAAREAKTQEGLDAFAKYFWHLWD